MCCKNRRNRRAPLVLLASQAAYGKYQEHQLKKQRPELESIPAPTTSVRDSYTTPRVLQEQDQFQQKLESSGVRPPSYTEAIVNQPDPRASPIEDAAEEFVRDWKRASTSSEIGSEGEKEMSWWEMKKAAKQAKKAAKWEAKGRKNGYW